MIQDEWGTTGSGATYTYDSAGKLIASTYDEFEGGGSDISYQYDILGYPMLTTASSDSFTKKYYYGFDSNKKTMVMEQSSWFNEGVVDDYAVFDGSKSYSISYQYKPFVIYSESILS